jgi:glyoxylase-like metal-dependent hydrolase (beta-lactamase superfamily II)
MTMTHFICVTCGTQYPASAAPPAGCPICQDERQYVNPAGQQWTTLEELRGTHHNTFRTLEPGVTAIKTEPKAGIGQQAHLIETPQGNLLWDCVVLIDDATVAEIQQRGGLTALALSHPHYYTTIVEWSRAFGGIPVYIHRDDAEWVMRPDPAIRFWEGETLELLPGATMIRGGGHYSGASVLHWAAGAQGRGALFSGDTIQVVADQRWVSFMYSYPNLIPLDAPAIRRIVAAVAPFEYARVYGAFGGVVAEDGSGAVRRSAERYLRQIGVG